MLLQWGSMPVLPGKAIWNAQYITQVRFPTFRWDPEFSWNDKWSPVYRQQFPWRKWPAELHEITFMLSFSVSLNTTLPPQFLPPNLQNFPILHLAILGSDMITYFFREGFLVSLPDMWRQPLRKLVSVESDINVHHKTQPYWQLKSPKAFLPTENPS